MCGPVHAHAHGGTGHGLAGLQFWSVLVVTGRAVKDSARAAPVLHTFAMGTEVPVLGLLGMTLAAQDIGLVERQLQAFKGSQPAVAMISSYAINARKSSSNRSLRRLRSFYGLIGSSGSTDRSTSSARRSPPSPEVTSQPTQRMSPQSSLSAMASRRNAETLGDLLGRQSPRLAKEMRQ